MKRSFKITLVGSDSIGKESLQVTLFLGAFPHGYKTCAWGGYSADFTFENQTYHVKMDVGNGLPDYDRLRPLCYPGTSVFFLCFSLNSAESFREMIEKFHPEVIEHCGPAPMVVIGLQADSERREVHLQEVDDFVSRISEKNQIEYMEVSALEGKNMDQMVPKAISSFNRWSHENPRSQKKGILSLFSKSKK